MGFLLLLAHFEESLETFSFVLSLAHAPSIRTLGKVTLSGGKLLFLFETSAYHQQTERGVCVCVLNVLLVTQLVTIKLLLKEVFKVAGPLYTAVNLSYMIQR